MGVNNRLLVSVLPAEQVRIACAHTRLGRTQPSRASGHAACGPTELSKPSSRTEQTQPKPPAQAPTVPQAPTNGRRKRGGHPRRRANGGKVAVVCCVAEVAAKAAGRLDLPPPAQPLWRDVEGAGRGNWVRGGQRCARRTAGFPLPAQALGVGAGNGRLPRWRERVGTEEGTGQVGTKERKKQEGAEEGWHMQ